MKEKTSACSARNDRLWGHSHYASACFVRNDRFVAGLSIQSCAFAAAEELGELIYRGGRDAD